MGRSIGNILTSTHLKRFWAPTMLETSLRGVAMVAPETTSFTVEKMTIDHQFELPGRLAKPQGIVVDGPWEQ